MTRILLSKRAKEDLKEISRYTQKEWGREQRNVYLANLKDRLEQLARGEITSLDSPELGQGYQRYIVGRHIIFFRHTAPQSIVVLRILHHRMNIAARLEEMD